MAMNEAPARRSRAYSPRETADVKTQAIADVLGMQLALSQKSPDRVDFHDTEAVRATVERYVRACMSAGVLPNVEGMAAQLGVSRHWVYKFLDKYPDSETARFIDRCRTEWASARIALSERGICDSTITIFLLLNSSLGFTNEHKIAISPPENPLQTADPEEARRRIAAAVASMPDDE